VFVFDTRANKRTNVDKISDFRYQDDSFFLENKIFTKLGSGTGSKPKKFKAKRLVSNYLSFRVRRRSRIRLMAR
jgi:hypothetical protein